MRPCLLLSFAMTYGALGHVAHGGPRPTPFTGRQPVSVTVTAAHGTVYRSKPLHPTLTVTMTATAPDERAVTILDDQYAVKYQCTLHGKRQGNRLLFAPGQRCEFAIATPDFCLLVDQRCQARLRDRKCSDEQAYLGKLTGTLTSGSVTQSASGDWKLSFDLAVDGCVLAEGHNNNGPVGIRGGDVTVRTL